MNITVTAEVNYMGVFVNCTSMEDAVRQADKLVRMGAKDIEIDGNPYPESNIK